MSETERTYDSNGLLHSFNDEPAVIRFNGDKEWWFHGDRHRENDQPAVLRTNGIKRWLRDGLLHRSKDLPAVDWGYSRGQEWYCKGERHRICGPNKSALSTWRVLGVFYFKSDY